MEYRYTMPQQFMEDGSVPVQWRLYGIINGFWISGKPVYASNKWFSDELQCSERHISRAFEILEKLGLLTRNIDGFKRLVLPGGVTPDVRGGRHGASGEGDMGRQDISDSISDKYSELPKTEDSLMVVPPKPKVRPRPKFRAYDESESFDEPAIDLDSQEEVPEAVLAPSSTDKYKEMLHWAEEVRGFKFPARSVLKQFKAFSMAKSSNISPTRLKERWSEFVSDKFWASKGFDWMDVVLSFEKRP